MARYALGLPDGTVANIIALDPADERAIGVAEAIAAAGYSLILLKDDGGKMGGAAVEPGDKIVSAKDATFQKGAAAATSPAPFAVVKTEPVLDALPAEKG